MRPIAGVAAIALAVALACGPIAPGPAISVALNACPANPCADYVQSGATPTCQEGVCVVAAQTTGLVLVVSLPGDSYFAPDRTFAVPFEHLFDNANGSCLPPTCARLPDLGVVTGSYLIPPSVAKMVEWDLGNAGFNTALPVQATYVPLWGANATVATSLGLPLLPVVAESVSNSRYGGYPGPGGGPGIAFSTYLSPGTYVRTLSPAPPFDEAFAPEVKEPVVITPGQPQNFETDVVNQLNVTNQEGTGSAIVPTFDITRAAGLDGWTAYLRDQTSGQVISSVKRLSGTETADVVLATYRVLPGPPMDALCNAELVVAPPEGAAIPKGVFVPLGGQSFSQAPYLALPAPVIVAGSVTTSAKIPVEADLIFEATGIADGAGKLYTAGQFEYTARASARSSSGRSLYTVELPPGTYRVSVRPSSATGAVTIVDAFAVNVGGGGNYDLVIAPPRSVHMRVVVADSRPLGAAAVDAIPVSCLCPTPPCPTSPACLPRAAQTLSAADGTIGGTTGADGGPTGPPGQLALDPGGYLVRVRPLDGSAFPWVVTPLTIPAATATNATDVEGGTVVVPAPVSAGLKLVDPGGNAIVRAIVQVFTAPIQSPPVQSKPVQGCPAVQSIAMTQPAVQIGSAVTDATTGVFKMYLALPQN